MIRNRLRNRLISSAAAAADGPAASGVNLARVALRAAMEQARENGGGRKAKPQPRTVPTMCRDGDGREPMGPGAAIGALITEGEWWAAIAQQPGRARRSDTARAGSPAARACRVSSCRSSRSGGTPTMAGDTTAGA